MSTNPYDVKLSLLASIQHIQVLHITGLLMKHVYLSKYYLFLKHFWKLNFDESCSNGEGYIQGPGYRTFSTSLKVVTSYAVAKTFKIFKMFYNKVALNPPYCPIIQIQCLNYLLVFLSNIVPMNRF